MNRIIRNSFSENCFSEWMRTNNGELVAVLCQCEEGDDSSLYAYEYTHAIITFFRQYDAEKVWQLKKSEIAELLLENCNYNAQMLDSTSGKTQPHPIPTIEGLFTFSDSIIIFGIGNYSISFIDRKNKNRKIRQSRWTKAKLERFTLDAYQKYSKYVFFKCIKKTELKSILLLSNESRITSKNKQSGENQNVDFLSVDFTNTDNNTTVPYRAVITGNSHSFSGVSCQDYCDFQKVQNGIAIAVADGAGSGKFSQFGAFNNVRSFIDCCEEREVDMSSFSDKLLRTIRNKHEILQSLRIRGNIQDFATLLGVCILDKSIVYVHIGDGAIFAHTIEGTTEYISEAETFGDESNVTYFTIEEDAKQHLYSGTLDKDKYDMLLIVTDGVYNAFEKEDRLPFISSVFNTAISDSEFSEIKLAELIDTVQIKDWGDDHSAILLDLRKQGK